MLVIFLLKGDEDTSLWRLPDNLSSYIVMLFENLVVLFFLRTSFSSIEVLDDALFVRLVLTLIFMFEDLYLTTEYLDFLLAYAAARYLASSCFRSVSHERD